MDCRHDGLRDIRTSYDSGAGLLVYHWICAHCETILDEAGRAEYRPRFTPGRTNAKPASPPHDERLAG